MSTKKINPRARPFQAMRRQHQNAAAEDYTELIAYLIEKQGEARTCEVAKHLGVSHVTAVRTLKRLRLEGYLKNTSRHQPLELSAQGQRLALQSREKHELLYKFLTTLGVPSHIAEEDVEGIEHHISTESLRAISRFLADR